MSSIEINGARGGDISASGRVIVVGGPAHALCRCFDAEGAEVKPPSWIPRNELFDAGFVEEKVVVLAGTGRRELWFEGDRTILREVESGPSTLLCSDSGIVAAWGHTSLLIGDVTQSSFRVRRAATPSSRGLTAALTRAGTKVVVSGLVAGRVIEWDLRTGDEVEHPLPGPEATHLALSDDGRFLYAGHDTLAWSRLWDTHSGEMLDLGGWIGDGRRGAPAMFFGSSLLRTAGDALLSKSIDGEAFLRIPGARPGRIEAFRARATLGRWLLCYPDLGVVDVLDLTKMP